MASEKANAIMKLIDAGFKAEEIRAILSEQKTEKPAEVADTPKPSPTNKETPEDAVKAQMARDAKSDKILDAIDKLTGTITTFMVNSTGRNSVDETVTVDEVLGKILNPDGEEA